MLRVKSQVTLPFHFFSTKPGNFHRVRRVKVKQTDAVVTMTCSQLANSTYLCKHVCKKSNTKECRFQIQLYRDAEVGAWWIVTETIEPKPPDLKLKALVEMANGISRESDKLLKLIGE